MNGDSWNIDAYELPNIKNDDIGDIETVHQRFLITNKRVFFSNFGGRNWPTWFTPFPSKKDPTGAERWDGRSASCRRPSHRPCAE
jgi:hypothetical protein